MAPLNMRACQWASTARNKLQLALLVPARPGIARGQRIGAESVRTLRSSQAEQFDKAPDAQTETEGADQKCRSRVVEPVPKLVEQTWSNEKQRKPPAALIAIVKPLDHGRYKQPNADDEQGKSKQIERRVDRLDRHYVGIVARSTKDADNDEQEYRHERKDGGKPDERSKP